MPATLQVCSRYSGDSTPSPREHHQGHFLLAGISHENQTGRQEASARGGEQCPQTIYSREWRSISSRASTASLPKDLTGVESAFLAADAALLHPAADAAVDSFVGGRRRGHFLRRKSRTRARVFSPLHFPAIRIARNDSRFQVRRTPVPFS